ncbi:MAG: pyridoxal phosphate-dependent aminotransferase [Pyramidobacter sp.]|jgi:threonine-phosphate decarboxylase
MLKKFDHGGDIYSRPVELDFSVNINPMGMPAPVRDALIAQTDHFDVYPDPKCRRLTAELSRFLDVPPQWLLFGNGAADLIIRWCLSARPKTALICAPTFSEYEKASLMAGASVEKFLLREEENFDVTPRIFDALKKGPDVFFLCNPNNPTGRLTPPELVEEIADFCEAHDITFVIDQCFMSFTDGTSALPLLKDRRRTVILDAFTKMYSIAGLRLGFLVSSSDALIHQVASFGQSWNVSTPAQIAGVAALGCGAAWIQNTRSFVTEETAFMRARLRALGLKVFDGAANYILFKSDVPLEEALLRQKILIRSCANYTGLDGRFYRVGVKTREKNDRLLAAMEKVLQEEKQR